MRFLEERRLRNKKELLGDIINKFSNSFPFLYELSKEINFELIPKSECIYIGENIYVNYNGLFDVAKAIKEHKYDVKINYQLNDKTFYMTVLHEMGHIIDLIAGDNKYFFTSQIQKFEKTMNSEAEFANDTDYSLQEFFAEACAYILSKNRDAFGLIQTKKHFKNIILTAEINFLKNKKRTA